MFFNVGGRELEKHVNEEENVPVLLKNVCAEMKGETKRQR